METNAAKTAKRNSVILTLSLMTGYSMVYMDKSMISTAIIPISSQFNLDASQTGWIMSLFFLGYSLMQIPGGWLSDRIGAKKVLMISLLLISIFSFIFGIASGLLMFIMVRFFSGMGHGGYPPSCSKAVADNFPQQRRTFIQSLILSTSGIGGILAFTLGANLISLNWRYAYVALGALFFVSFLLVWRFVPNIRPEIVTAKQKGKTNYLAHLKNKNILILFVALMLLNCLLYGNMSWLPSYISTTFKLSINQTGLILAINAIFQTIATIFAGSLLSKLFLHKEKQFILMATLLSAGLIFLFINTKNLALSIVYLILISMISVSAFTAIFTWPHKILDAKIIGASIGIINTGGTLGGFLAPMILGYLIKLSGGSFTLAFSFMALMSVLCGLTVLLVKADRKA